ncbi:MAG: exonuclease SbcCD subunit D [Chloroflexi bacterium]|nr:exonuclease SbcCD subunit D [Chloroflexota bacterium]
MKLLHFADLHIGVENYGRTDPDTGLSTRLLDFLATFDELVDFALANHVDAVLFAGDAYKSRDPSQTHQREFASRIARLANEGIPVLLVVGNHDLPAIPGRATAVEIFPTLAIERVFVADRIATILLPTRSGPLQVVSLPWVRRSAFLARDETRDLTLDDITRRLEESLTGLLSLEFQRLDPSIPAVLVGHVTARGASVGSERSMMLGRDHSLNISDLANPLLDYVALGHIHKHQTLSENPKVAYAGSLQRVDFSEEDEQKGFCVIDIDPDRPQGTRLVGFHHQPVQARPFLTIDVQVRPHDEEPTDRVLKAIAGKYIDGAIVRLRIEVPEELESRLQETPIRDALSHAHYIAAIQRNVVRPRRTRLSPEASRGLAPQEALRLYLDSRNTEPERAALLLRHAESLMREELGDDSE